MLQLDSIFVLCVAFSLSRWNPNLSDSIRVALIKRSRLKMGEEKFQSRIKEEDCDHHETVVEGVKMDNNEKDTCNVMQIIMAI